MEVPPLVPELDVSDLRRLLEVYVGVFGFSIHIQRPEDCFAYLIREDAHLMLEDVNGTGRRFTTAPLAHPFGRGVNLQIRVSNVDELYHTVIRSGCEVPISLEERWYRHGTIELGNRQFVVADPDGYLLRFFGDLGTRPVQHAP